MSLRSILDKTPPPKPPSKYPKCNPRTPARGELAAQRFLEEGNFLPGTSVRIALGSPSGCFAVRGALEGATPELQQRILQEFVGKVPAMLVKTYTRDLLKYVMSRYDEMTAGFVLAELLEAGFDLSSKHCLELLTQAVREAWSGETTQDLLSIAVDQLKDHWRGRYTVHLYTELLRNGGDDHRKAIMDGLVSIALENWSEISRALRTPTGEGDKSCIFLVSDVVATGERRVDPLVTALLRDTDLIRGLASRKYGSVLIKALLNAAGKEASVVQERLCSVLYSLPETELLYLQESLITSLVCSDSLEENAQEKALMGSIRQARAADLAQLSCVTQTSSQDLPVADVALYSSKSS